MANSLVAYRQRVLRKHRHAVRFHSEVLGAVEQAMSVPRSHRTLDRLVIDMLMLQSFKSDATVLLLAQHGLMEDTATIVRRLLELSVTAVYIGAEPDAQERKRRCGMYLSFMWRQLRTEVRKRLPPNVRGYWSSVARSYARYVPRGAKSWGPRWIEMFREIGQGDLYRKDYAFLSSIAHGSPDNQLFTFAATTIRVHNDQFASVLLVHATRYFLAVIEQWNRRYKLMDKATFNSWVRRATTEIFPVEAV